MAIKNYKPTSPGRRGASVSTYEEITCTKPEKSLLVSKKKTGGRNAHGRITVRHIGGGNKQKIRLIDFKRNKDGIPAKVATIEYDPNIISMPCSRRRPTIAKNSSLSLKERLPTKIAWE